MHIKTRKDALRLLKGRKIVDIEVNSFRDGRGPGTRSTSPRITLDDGSVIIFQGEETEVNCYGVAMIQARPRADKGAK